MKDRLLEHQSDGIQEYDNDLPKWWVWLFIITIVWGLGYMVWFHFTDTPEPREQLALDMKALKELQTKTQMAALKDSAGEAPNLENGKAIYVGKCAVCHGQKGEGLVGPNLTDAYWLHGAKPEEIKKSITLGIPAKGMIAWNALLKPAEINDVTAFVISLKGTSPPNPKAPQGEKVE